MRIRSPNDAIHAGIGLAHQHCKLVPTLTATENITLGSEISIGPFLKIKDSIKKIEEIFRGFGIEVSPYKKVSDLSVGDMQRVEILKVLYRGANIQIIAPLGLMACLFRKRYSTPSALPKAYPRE